MVRGFAQALQFAIAVYPLLAAVFTLPFLIHHYHKYGSVPFMRFLAVYLFVFYLLCVLTLVILPLPETMDYRGAPMNFVPFSYVSEIVEDITFNPADPLSWMAFVLNSRWLEVILNILMTLPFGLFLRYYFHASKGKTVLYSFILSLLIEVTQLTAIYGIFPRPYRSFDVNDLIGNTFGGYLGWITMPLFTRHIMSRNAIDSKAYENGKVISFTRRLVALLFDSSIVMFTGGFLQWMFPGFSILLYSFALMTVLPLLWHGQTVGKYIVRIRLYNASGGRYYILRLIVRQFFAWVILFGTLFYGSDAALKPIYRILGEGQSLIAVLILWLVFFADVLKSRKRSDKRCLYEEWTGVSNESTIVIPKEK